MNKNHPTIGFIGFGELGRCVTGGLHKNGADVAAFDLLLEDADGAKRLKDVAGEIGVTLCDTREALAARTDIFISAVTCADAVTAASQMAPYLKEHHIYVDLNSTSPAVKRDVCKVIEDAGAQFVEIGVLGGIATKGYDVALLLCGGEAKTVAGVLASYGMDTDTIEAETGAAAAVKMFRSIVVKGMEALFLECVLAAEQYGATEQVLDTIEENYPGIGQDLANFFTTRTAVHAERRSHEMEEVSETLRAMGLDPLMSEASARRLGEVAKLGLKEKFQDKHPESFKEFYAAIKEAQAKHS
ncbi:MAG: DUF1932 domain-containing protein [Rhodospirillaceae bacterium]|jgi:3-hydroxyisobutyrate dehydrogenase-like beta-hydroxyacid dehydrogenase